MVDLHDDDEFLLRLTILALALCAFIDLLPDADGYSRHPLYCGFEVEVDIVSPPLQQG